MSDRIATENFVDSAVNDRIATELYANPVDGVGDRIATEDWVTDNPASAFPVPEFQTGTTSVTTATNVDLPDGIVAGDLIMFIGCLQAANNVGLNGVAGWTAIVSQIANPGLYVMYKFAAGGETGISLTTFNGAARNVAHWTAKFNGTAHASTAPVAAGVGSHDPPSLNPSTWDIEKTLWLAICSSIAAVSGKPTGYTLYEFANGAGGNWVVGKENEAASEDPATFTGSNDTFSATVAIRPAAA